MLEENQEKLVKCEDCGREYSADSYCVDCDESNPPSDEGCEYCDKPATRYVQCHSVCQDHFDQAYHL